MPTKLGEITVGTPIALAPMAGVTNAPFRRICREQAVQALKDLGISSTSGAASGLYVCEMITARALVEGSSRTLALIKPDPEETFRSVQLHGVDPETMYRGARMLVRQGLADHLDINFGCPVPKVTRKGAGAALPWKIERFGQIVAAVVAGARKGEKDSPRDKSVPVTAKIRIGIDADHETYRDAGKLAQKVGASAVVLHGRSANQYYSGSANWEAIAQLRQDLEIPVWGNGDIFSAEDALAMFAQTGCAGVEIGRGCQGRPWLFYDLSSALNGSDNRARPNLGQVCEMALRHTQMLSSWMGNEERALRDMRKHLGWYFRGFAVGGDFRRALTSANSMQELEQLFSTLDPSLPFPPDAEGKRGRRGNPRKTHLPEGWLATREVDAAAARILEAAKLDTSLDEGGY